MAVDAPITSVVERCVGERARKSARHCGVVGDDVEQTRNVDVQNEPGQEVHDDARDGRRRRAYLGLVPERGYCGSQTEPGRGLIVDGGQGLLRIQIASQCQPLSEHDEDGEVNLTRCQRRANSQCPCSSGILTVPKICRTIVTTKDAYVVVKWLMSIVTRRS